MNALQIVCLMIISGCTGALLGSTLVDVFWAIRKARLKKKILDARDAQGDWLEEKNEGNEERADALVRELDKIDPRLAECGTRKEETK